MQTTTKAGPRRDNNNNKNKNSNNLKMRTIYCWQAEATIYRSQAKTLFASFATKGSNQTRSKEKQEIKKELRQQKCVAHFPASTGLFHYQLIRS